MVPPVPKLTVDASDPANVKLLLITRDLLSAIVNVAVLAGAVITTLLTLVAAATQCWRNQCWASRKHQLTCASGTC